MNIPIFIIAIVYMLFIGEFYGFEMMPNNVYHMIQYGFFAVILALAFPNGTRISLNDLFGGGKKIPASIELPPILVEGK